MPLDIDWDNQPLGEMSDAALAEKLGCGWRSVYRNRTKRGIESSQSRSMGKVPVDVLGTDIDAVIAERFMVSLAHVQNKRTKHGIKPYSDRGSATGCASGGSSRILSKEIVELLGTISDKAIAEQEGVHFTTVKHWRVSRGIPPFNQEERSKRIDWKLIAHLLPLGEVPDADIAKFMSLGTSSVAEMRIELGIKRCDYREVCVCGDENETRGAFCSDTCRTRMGILSKVCGIKINKYERNEMLDKLLWGLATLTTSITQRSGRKQDRKAL
jgi:hypothetical protein